MAGRPTSWTEEIEQEAWKYLEEWGTVHGHAVPSVVGLCAAIGRAKSTIYDWSNEEDKQFSDILAAIKEKQELVTFNMSLTGEYNATIAKLLLGKHGYHDKQSTELSGKDGSAIEIDQSWTVEVVGE